MTVLVWLVLSLIWGTTWLAIKIGLGNLPPFTFAAIRFLVASVPLTILVLLRRHALPRRASEWRFIIWTGFLMISLNYGLVFWGENQISSGLTAICYVTHPLSGMFIAHYYLPSERITLPKIAGVVLGILGVALIFINQLTVGTMLAFFGALAVIVAALGTAFAGVAVKSRGSHFDPIALTWGQMLSGMVPLFVTGLWLEGNPFALQWSGRAAFVLLYLALVGSTLAFVLLYWLMQRMDVTKTQLIPLASTLVAVVAGNLVLNETYSSRTLAGAVSILLGLALYVWSTKRGRNRKNPAVASVSDLAEG